MPEDVPQRDIVDRAVKALVSTQGAEEPPRAVTEQIRRDINERHTIDSVRPVEINPPETQITWLKLAACLVLMIIGSWVVGFHKSIFSRVAGRSSFPNGTVFVYYTDGRVIAVIDGDS